MLKIPSCFGQTEGIKIPPIHNSDIATSDQGSSPLPRIFKSVTQFCVPGCKQLPGLGSNSTRKKKKKIPSRVLCPAFVGLLLNFVIQDANNCPVLAIIQPGTVFRPSKESINKLMFHFGRCGNEVCWHCNQGYMLSLIHI